MYMKKIASFCQILKKMLRKKIGSFFCLMMYVYKHCAELKKNSTLHSISYIYLESPCCDMFLCFHVYVYPDAK